MTKVIPLPGAILFLAVLASCGPSFSGDSAVTTSTESRAEAWANAHLDPEQLEKFQKDLQATTQGRQSWGRSVLQMVADEVALEPTPTPQPIPTEDPTAHRSRVQALLSGSLSFQPDGIKADGDTTSIYFHVVNQSNEAKPITHFAFIPKFIDENGRVVLGDTFTQPFAIDDTIGSGMFDEVHIEVKPDEDGYLTDPQKFKTLRYAGVTITEIDWGDFDRVTSDS